MSLALGALLGVLHNPFAFAPLFLLVGVAQAGVRLGRKTYLVDGGAGSQTVTMAPRYGVGRF